MSTSSPAPASAYWSLPAGELLALLGSGSAGLAESEATARLAREGPNTVRPQGEATLVRLARRQFSSPLVLILVVGATISLFVREWGDAITILVILLGSAVVGVAQETRASAAMLQLRQRLALTTRVRRDGALRSVPASALVPGDLVELSAGNLVPADGVVLASRDFLVVEAGLTGESFPVEKSAGVAAAGAPLRERHNCVFLGSSVRSGTASVLVALALPYVAPAARWFGFVPLGGGLLAAMLALVVAYALATEGVKRALAAPAAKGRRA